jgi:hypothetical protein
MIVELGVLAAAYALIRAAATRWAHLSDDGYRRPILLLSLVREPRALVATLGPSLPLFLAWPRLHWTALGGAPWLRPLACVLALAATLPLINSAPNRYYNQRYLVDRVFLGALAVLVFAHPAFAAPLVGLAFVLSWQRLLPLSSDLGFLINKNIALYVVVAFVAAQYVALFSTSAAPAFLVFVLAMHGAHYVHSAVDKLRIGWLRDNELIGLLGAGIAHGHPSARRFAAWLRRFNRPLLLATIAVELAAALWCWHWLGAVGLLVAAAVFHVAVFVVSGMDFFAWVLLDLWLATTAWLAHDERIFGVAPLVAALALIAVGRWAFEPQRLAWIDARLCHVYRFALRGTDGKLIELRPADFAPYEDLFFAGKFRYLSDEKLLVHTWAETGPELARAIRAATSPDELARLAERLGRNYYDAERAAQMEDFLRALFAGRAACVVIRFSTLWFDGDEFRVIDDRILREVDL